jgi:site-specific DNA recombinase
MTPTHAIKKGLCYRYYVSRRLIPSVRTERCSETGQRLPAPQLERLIVERLRIFFTDSVTVTEALPPQRRDGPSVKHALAAAADIVRGIAAGGEDQSFAILRPLIAQVQVHSDRIDIDLRAAMVAQALLTGGGGTNLSRDRESEGDPEAPYPARARNEGAHLHRLAISAQLKRAGTEMKFVIDDADQGSKPDASLVRLLIRAHSLARRLAASPASNLEDVGAQEGMGAPYAARLMRLNFLAPDIVVAILNGRQPVNLTARKLMTDTRLPFAWPEQRVTLGFMPGAQSETAAPPNRRLRDLRPSGPGKRAFRVSVLPNLHDAMASSGNVAGKRVVHTAKS